MSKYESRAYQYLLILLFKVFDNFFNIFWQTDRQTDRPRHPLLEAPSPEPKNMPERNLSILSAIGEGLKIVSNLGQVAGVRKCEFDVQTSWAALIKYEEIIQVGPSSPIFGNFDVQFLFLPNWYLNFGVLLNCKMNSISLAHMECIFRLARPTSIREFSMCG